MNILEIIGYLASVIVAVSLMMSSLRLLRWINLVGAAIFSTYGFLIGAYPVGILNAFIAIVDIYFLSAMYFKKEYFKALPVRADNKYLLEFLKYYKEDIKKFFPDFIYNPEINKYSFFVLRDMFVAGVILARDYEEGILKISLDYTVPQYRDFKVGRYVYEKHIKTFIDDGYKLLITFPSGKNHIKYVQRMGFIETNHNGKICYLKNLS